MQIPKHVAVIMDGNRRWARQRGWAVVKGHEYAVETTVEALIEEAGRRGIKYLTLWAFSTENWQREQGELRALMRLFRRALKTKVARFIEQGARLKVIGDLGRFEPELQRGMEEAVSKSAQNKKITVTFALSYGGRDEIRRAVEKGGVEFEKYLDTAFLPEPDLIIRTGGEQRTSGFLLWSAPYAEWYFTQTLFPDFGKRELDGALAEYQRRQRRFGR